ncbi:MAG: 1-phosphofructokinase [Ilumatobacteraceae bacterium]
MSRSSVVTITANPALDHTVWVPGFRAGEVNRVERDQLTPGGKGVNVAAVLAALGVPAVVGGFLGADNGEAFEWFFAERGIGDRFVRVPGRTRTGIKLIDEVTSATTDVNFAGLAVDGPATDEVLARLVIDAAAARWVALCGSLPPGAPPDLYRRLAEVARAAGASVALDTSGPALAAGLTGSPTLVKPNRAELEELVGRSLPDDEALLAPADELRAGGVGTVIVSLGEHGALFVAEEGAVLARPPQTAVVSTVGAGDSMVAGTIVADCRGLPLAEAARLATACSVVAISQVGPDLDPRRVEELAADVTIETLR